MAVSQQSIDDVPRLHPMDIPGAVAVAPMTFADITVELRLTELELPQLSFALLLETMVRCEKARGVENLGARIGINEEIARRIVNDAQRRVELLGAAHLIFKSLIPHEAELLRLLSQSTEWRAKFRSVG